MSWREITVTDVEAHLNAGELAEYRQHAAQIEDPLPIIIDDVTALVRGYVGVRHQLQDRGIPDELRIPAIDLVIHRLAKRVSKAADGDADRRGAATTAGQLLTLVAEGKFAISGSASASTTSTTNAASGGYGSDPKFTSPPYPSES